MARLEKKGFTVNKRLNAYSNVDELRAEVKRITYSIDVEQSIRFSRRMLVACVTGLEFLNKRYNPFEVQLEGWSESVMENVDDYDGVFEELYVKYRSKVSCRPRGEVDHDARRLGDDVSSDEQHVQDCHPEHERRNQKQNPELVKNMMDGRAEHGAEESRRRADRLNLLWAVRGTTRCRDLVWTSASLMGGISYAASHAPNEHEPERRTGADRHPIEEEDELSDIMSISGESTGGEIKEVNVEGGHPSRRSDARRQKRMKLICEVSDI